MKKTIKIADKEIEFEVNASIILIYHQEFCSDYFYDVAQALSYIDGDGKIDMRRYRSDIIAQIIYALAKCADSTLPPINEWLSGFDLEEFNVDAIFIQLIGMLVKNQKTVKKN